LSTQREIRGELERDIRLKTERVVAKRGRLALLDGASSAGSSWPENRVFLPAGSGIHIVRIMDGLMTEEDERALGCRG
jgi:hypothetical protein